jgi:Arc/MetJ-type ribon-helix-helix transcriptional regulator
LNARFPGDDDMAEAASHGAAMIAGCTTSRASRIRTITRYGLATASRCRFREAPELVTKSGIFKPSTIMEKATLTISLPRTIEEYVAAKLREGRFSTPSEYIRSLVRDEQDLTGPPRAAVLARRGIAGGNRAPANPQHRRNQKRT